MRLHSEKQTCPRRRNPTALKTALSGRQTERDGKAFWDAEQSDCHPSRHVRACIASQPRCPRKPRVRPLGTRKGRGRDREEWRAGRFNLDLDALMAHQLDACPAVETTTPIPPEYGLRSDAQWMQQHAHLARLCGGIALPLTLLAQGTGTATADTSPIHHAQAPVGFSALLMGDQLLVNGSLRIVYEARIADCRACPKRPQCQWHGHQAQHPRTGGSAPLRLRETGRAESSAGPACTCCGANRWR
jgi:hypothetical protein